MTRIFAMTFPRHWIEAALRSRWLAFIGVIFFLCRMREVGIYVTLFAIGHSVTLLLACSAARCHSECKRPRQPQLKARRLFATTK